MANNYKVKVQVEIAACRDDVDDAPTQSGVGAFEYVISAEQAHSIDACEQRLLQTNYAALRDAFAHHLEVVSQQYALEVAGSLAKCESRILRENTEGEGQQIMAYMEQQATTILQEYGYTPDGAPTETAADHVAVCGSDQNQEPESSR